MAQEENKEVEKSEEEMMAEWETMASDDSPENTETANTEQAASNAEKKPVVEERILDQDEIDSLLGVDKSEDLPNSGLKQLVNSSVISYEKLPMLSVIYDRFERLMSTSLRQFTADDVDITIDAISSVRFGEYLNSIPLPAGISVVNAEGLGGAILLVYESKLIFGVVEVLLGGRRSKYSRVDDRDFTKIERSMIEDLTQIILNDLAGAFEPVAPVEFKYERMETNPRFAFVTQENNACILTTVRISLDGRDGTVHFCMPYATLEPIREQLLQKFAGEKFGQDNIWENHLAQNLYDADVVLKVELDEVQVPLNEALEWKKDDVLKLTAKPNHPVKLKMEGVTTMIGRVGNVDEKLAVKVVRTISDMSNLQED
ncbi:MAG: flagellar motor switch protein FliM [Proteobacteria bacterium]|nr:flagellar motor switch protein FliM [Pseudomonadota bacterium]